MEAIIIIVAIVCCAIAFFVGRSLASKPVNLNNEQIIKENKQLIAEQNELKHQYELTEKDLKAQLQLSKQVRDRELKRLDDKIKQKEHELSDAESRTRFEKDKAALIQKDYEQKLEVIENTQQLAEQAHKDKLDALNIEYDLYKETIETQKTELNQTINQIQEELDSLKATKAAAIQAAQNEQRIKESMDFYSLKIPREEQGDISLLLDVREKVSKPRAVSMIIWSHYFQPIAKAKFPKILGKTDVCGIYKITDQKTGQCYIGQAVDIRKRWNEHCKHGLSIDTPQGNKLYAAMKEDGLENFTFELVEECEPKDLDQKEKYFIELYQSKEFGFNSIGGNN